MSTVPRAAAAALVLAILHPPSATGQSGPWADPAAWRGDLRHLAAELPRIHPNPFTKLSRPAWDSAVAALDARLPRLRPHEAYVAVQQLLALIGDGHTGLAPLFDRVYPLRYYPLELHRFADGLYVRSADPAYRDLVGGRVVRWGRVGADEAIAAAVTTISADNRWWGPSWAGTRLIIPEIVDGLGLADDVDRLAVVVERDGREIPMRVRPAGRMPVSDHDPRGGIDRSGWVDMRGAGAAPAWLRQRDRPYFVEWRPDDATIYVAYRAVWDWPEERNTRFWARVFALVDSLPVGRLILDLRENVGGEGSFNLQVVRGLVARPAIDQRGRLFAVVGPRTFSAAMNLATELERYTRVTFVGEPTGSTPHFFGDHRPLPLPRTGLTVHVSTLWWQTLNPRDRREAILPTLYAPVTAADYRANRDPAMDAILAFGTGPSLAERMDAAVLAGDTLAAGRLLAVARDSAVNRYRDLEAETNALGYRLLNGHRPEAALAVFRINARAFPRSANVFDSLGEAYAAVGRRDEAIAAFRAALERDPHYAPSVAWLERLGAR